MPTLCHSQHACTAAVSWCISASSVSAFIDHQLVLSRAGKKRSCTYLLRPPLTFLQVRVCERWLDIITNTGISLPALVSLRPIPSSSDPALQPCTSTIYVRWPLEHVRHPLCESQAMADFTTGAWLVFLGLHISASAPFYVKWLNYSVAWAVFKVQCKVTRVALAIIFSQNFHNSCTECPGRGMVQRRQGRSAISLPYFLTQSLPLIARNGRVSLTSGG
eukprot:scaffold151930_cov15-Tisochrysis_lutea.AAC.1